MTQFSGPNLAGAAVIYDDWLVGSKDIFFSNAPTPVTKDFRVKDDWYNDMAAAAAVAGTKVAIPYGYVVGIDDDGLVVPATYGNPGTRLLGVTAAVVHVDEAFGDVTDPADIDASWLSYVPVYVQGYFDIDGCTFPAEFTNAAEKLAAAQQPPGVFQGSNLLFGQKAYDEIIANPQPDITVDVPVGLIGSWNDSGVWTDSGAWHDGVT